MKHFSHVQILLLLMHSMSCATCLAITKFNYKSRGMGLAITWCQCPPSLVWRRLRKSWAAQKDDRANAHSVAVRIRRKTFLSRRAVRSPFGRLDTAGESVLIDSISPNPRRAPPKLPMKTKLIEWNCALRNREQCPDCFFRLSTSEGNSKWSARATEFFMGIWINWLHHHAPRTVSNHFYPFCGSLLVFLTLWLFLRLFYRAASPTAKNIVGK